MSQLAGKTVFVTGATGFLGGALARRLVADGVKVKALVRRPKRDDYIRGIENIELVTGDILEQNRMVELLEGCDTVFHVAAALSGAMDFQLEVNVGGTSNLANAALQTGVRHFVHVSSIAVYGYDVRGIVREDTRFTASLVPYNHSKAEAEKALQHISREQGLNYSIIRPGMIFGARSKAWTDSLMRFAKLKPTPFFGDASGTIYPIYVDDVVDLMILLATHPAAVNEAFNCVLDPPPSIREFVGVYQNLAGHDSWVFLPTGFVKLLAPLADLMMTWRGEPQEVGKLIPYLEEDIRFSMDKAHALLGWQARFSLEAGIKETIPYLREKGLL